MINPGIVILEGRAQGVRVARGRVAEVFVSPGSSVGFVASPETAPKVTITDSRRSVGLRGKVQGFATSPAADEGQVVALALDKAGGLRGFALAHLNLPTSETVAIAEEGMVDEPEQSPERSPTARKPYINLTAPAGDVERLTAAERLTVTGRRFPPGAALEVLVDREVVDRATVREDGAFSVTITAPSAIGVHTLIVRDAHTKQVIDGAQLKVNRGKTRKVPAQTGEPRGGKPGEVHGNHEEYERAGERVRVHPPTRGRGLPVRGD